MGDELVAMIQSGSRRTGTFAAAWDVNVPDTARLGPYYGAVAQLRRPLRLLDLIPTQPMSGRSFDYTQEGGSFDTASETVEAAVKPMADLELQDAQVVAKTVAHWVKLRRQQLADVPALGTITQNRLTYGCLSASRIRSSPGTGPARTSPASSPRAVSGPSRSPPGSR